MIHPVGLIGQRSHLSVHASSCCIDAEVCSCPASLMFNAFLRVDLDTRSWTFLPIHASAGCAAWCSSSATRHPQLQLPDSEPWVEVLDSRKLRVHVWAASSERRLYIWWQKQHTFASWSLSLFARVRTHLAGSQQSTSLRGSRESPVDESMFAKMPLATSYQYLIVFGCLEPCKHQ